MKKVFILDTNVLLSNPLSIYKFDDNDVVIPISVIEEIDTFKKDQSDIGRNAREVSRILDKLRTRGTLSSGIRLFEREDSGQLYVYLGHNMDILPELLASSTDNHILAIGLTLQKQFGDTRKVLIITKDTNLRIKSDAFGLAAEDFAADKVDISHLYTGMITVSVSPKVINDFYTNREIRLPETEMHPNQFIIFEDEEDQNAAVFGVYDAAEDRVKMIEPRSEGVWGIFSRNM
ncbi:MAG: PIN domain-containing protein, partial [Proteobacteria bacterium]|nr:PIN domain-containing protein [Pseudomonadota bacterium]